MRELEFFVEELNKVIPFRIRFKDESWEMQALYVVVCWFCPSFLDSYTTVIGNTVYFPNREFVHRNLYQTKRILAHEAVHLLDAKRFSFPVFALGYISPQVFSIGVYSFPWLGWWSLLFLLFLLPLPSPFRAFAESRGFAMDVLTAEPHEKEATLEACVASFSDLGYYRMFPFPALVRRMIRYWVTRAELGKDKVLISVLLLFEMESTN